MCVFIRRFQFIFVFGAPTSIHIHFGIFSISIASNLVNVSSIFKLKIYALFDAKCFFIRSWKFTCFFTRISFLCDKRCSNQDWELILKNWSQYCSLKGGERLEMALSSKKWSWLYKIGVSLKIHEMRLLARKKWSWLPYKIGVDSYMIGDDSYKIGVSSWLHIDGAGSISMELAPCG